MRFPITAEQARELSKLQPTIKSIRELIEDAAVRGEVELVTPEPDFRVTAALGASGFKVRYLIEEGDIIISWREG